MVNFGLYVIFIVYHHFPETPPPRYTGNVCLVLLHAGEKYKQTEFPPEKKKCQKLTIDST